MTRFTTKHLIATGGASLMLLLTACGSDDNSADNAEACVAWIAADDAAIGYLFNGEGDADSVKAAIDSAVTAAPDDFVDTVTGLGEAVGPQLDDPETEASEETLDLYREAVSWAGENCDVETIDVTVTDYEYDGIPTEMSTGYTVTNFTNEGQEQHEMLAFKINDGVTETLDEIFALPEEEVFGKITLVNATFAVPGDTDVASWNLETPGNYAVVCFVPVGSVGETQGDGPPHLAEGMIQAFTVTS